MRRVGPPFCAAILAIALGVLAPTATAGELAPQRLTRSAVFERVPSLESEILFAVNRFRVAHGRMPFRLSGSLRTAAVQHSREMARLGYFAHVSPGGMPFWRRIAWYYPRRGYRDWGVGENLEYGSPSLTAVEALHNWLASALHRQNVLSRTWRDAGAGAVFVAPAPGIYGDLPTMIVTLDFGERRR